MSTDKKIFDDIARVAGGAVNMMSGLQQQVRDDVRSRFEDFTGRLDLIARHEFDDLHAVVHKLHAKIAELEKAGGHKGSSARKAAAPKAKKAVKTVKKAKATVKRKATVKAKTVKAKVATAKASVTKAKKKKAR